MTPDEVKSICSDFAERNKAQFGIPDEAIQRFMSDVESMLTMPGVAEQMETLDSSELESYMNQLMAMYKVSTL